MKKTVLIIEQEDAARYKKSLLAIRRRLVKAFENSDDMSFKKWVNTHGPIIDDLLFELGYRGND